jgi:hypothetical protein
MTPRKGDRVRVTYEAEYEYYDEGQKGHRVTSTVGRASLFAPPGATLEVLEDLRPGDVYRDDDAALVIYVPISSVPIEGYPWLNANGDRVADSYATRPLTLLVRDGREVTP